MPADYWLNLESNYQEIKARLAEEEKLQAHLDWIKRFPYSEMVKLGWLPKKTTAKDKLVELLQYMGIASVDQWREVWPKVSVAYRQNNSHEVFPEAISAWLRQGEIKASSIECKPYDKAKFRKALDTIRTLTEAEPEVFVPAMQKACAEAGVAVVFVPSIPKTGISGATRWLNSNKALIQLSLRYRTNDHLWFTFFHEAGHILLHGKKELFLEYQNGLNDEKEQEANHFAQNELIPVKAMNRFIAQSSFTRANIQAFAREVGIASGVVVGQLQHRGLIDYKVHSNLKQSYKWAHE
jgi:Zn-dependent peptidase ImmA (M78 family)